jgi:hypothetical protein
MGPCCPSGASSSWRIAHRRAERGCRAAVLDERVSRYAFRLDTLSVGERVRKAAANERQPQRAERAIKHSPPGSPSRSGSRRNLLLITDPEPDQAPEMGQKPLALILWIGHVDRFGEHAVEVRR